MGQTGVNIVDGVLELEVGSGRWVRKAQGDTGWTDYELRFLYKCVNPGAYGPRLGAHVRRIDGNNYYQFTDEDYPTGTTRKRLKKRVGGTLTTIDENTGSAYVTNVGTWYEVWVRVYGNNLKAFWNGTEILSATPTEHAYGGIEFITWDTGSKIHLDTIFVRKFAYPEPSHGDWGAEEKTFSI